MSPEEQLVTIATFLSFMGISVRELDGEVKPVQRMVEELVDREARLRAQVENQKETILEAFKDRNDYLKQITYLQKVSTEQVNKIRDIEGRLTDGTGSNNVVALVPEPACDWPSVS